MKTFLGKVSLILHESGPASGKNFSMNGFARSLALTETEDNSEIAVTGAKRGKRHVIQIVVGFDWLGNNLHSSLF